MKQMEDPMYYPTAAELDAAALVAHPGFAGFTEAEQDDAIAEGVMWLTIWRSVYPAIDAAPHGLGPHEGEVPPVALLRASKMACAAFDDLPFGEKRPVRETAVRWLKAWRFVLAMGQPPADYVYQQPGARPYVPRLQADPRFVRAVRLGAGALPHKPRAPTLHEVALQFQLASEWPRDLRWYDRLLIWATHRTLRLADRMFGGRGQ